MSTEKVQIEEHGRVSDTDGAELEGQKSYTHVTPLVVTDELRKRRARITYGISLFRNRLF